MQTIDTKVLDMIEEWNRKSYHNEGQKKAALQVAIISALKEQDRHTRHACAEAVSALTKYGGCDEPLVLADSAHTACMNVRAV